MEAYEKWHTPSAVQDVAKLVTQYAIPNDLRANMWLLSSGAQKLMQENALLYETLLVHSQTNFDAQVAEQIQLVLQNMCLYHYIVRIFTEHFQCTPILCLLRAMAMSK